MKIDLFETQISFFTKNNNKHSDTPGYRVSNYRIIIRIGPWQSHLVHHGRLTNSLGIKMKKRPFSFGFTEYLLKLLCAFSNYWTLVIEIFQPLMTIGPAILVNRFVTIIWHDGNQENVLIFYNHNKFLRKSVRWLLKLCNISFFSKLLRYNNLHLNPLTKTSV